MNKHNFLFFLALLAFVFSPVHAQELEQADDCPDCPTETVQEVMQVKTKESHIVSLDSLHLLHDKNSAVYNKKFKEKFKDQYKGKADFTYEKVEKKVGFLDQIKQSIKDWFNRNFTRKAGEQLSANYFVVILRILGFAMMGVMIYYLIRAYIQKDIYWFVKKKSKTLQTLNDLTTEDFRTTNFDRIIADAIVEKQYRLAIRLSYLWLLQRLQEEGKIIWAPEKTNADYLYELQESSERETFTYLSYLYNNIWYGEYEISEAEFFKAKKSFDTKLKPTRP